MLFELNSTLDLVCRGYNREDILLRTGEDVGYHSSGVTSQLKGIDRNKYKLEFVLTHNKRKDFVELIDLYKDAVIDKPDVFRKLGLAYYNDKGLSMRYIFEGAGFLDEFMEADKIHKIKSMKSGFVKKYNEESPGKVKELREKSQKALKAKKEASIKKAKKQAKQEKVLIEKAKEKNYFNIFEGFSRKVEEHSYSEGDAYVDKYNAKSPEEVMKEVFSQHFGEDDIEFDEKLILDNTALTFFAYVRSLDCYFDLMYGSEHGYHFFDSSSEADKNTLFEKESRIALFSDDEKNTPEKIQLEKEVHQWTVLDEIKRDLLAKNNVNWVTFWDENLDDARLWFAMECPVGCDWKREYSWIPKRVLDYEYTWPNFKPGVSTAHQAAKAANWKEFYKNEIAMWNNNPTFPKKWGTLQARLYANRLKYQESGRIFDNHQYYNGKLPIKTSEREQIFSKEILRGFRIGAFMPSSMGFTSFNTKLMQMVINNYKPESIYDFCMGWGERLFTALSNNIKYTGIDINEPVCEGNKLIAEHYNVDSNMYSIVCSDSAKIDNRKANDNAEAIITCPPYLDVEIFTDKGAENLPEDEFYEWFKTAVEMAINDSTKLVAIQTNQECKPHFMEKLKELGLKFEDEYALEKQISHMHRSKDGSVKRKKEYESMIIYKVVK